MTDNPTDYSSAANRVIEFLGKTEELDAIRKKYKNFDHPALKNAIILFLQMCVAERDESEERKTITKKHGVGAVWPPDDNSCALMIAKSLNNIRTEILSKYDYKGDSQDTESFVKDGLATYNAVVDAVNINPGLLKDLTTESPGGFDVYQWNALADENNARYQRRYEGEKMIEELGIKKNKSGRGRGSGKKGGEDTK